MRRGFGILSLVLTIVVIAVVGAFAYQAGWSEGLSQHAPEGTTAVAPYPYYGYGPHFFGFGWIFGLLFFLFLAFIFFRIVAFGLFGGWRRGGWGYGRGMGHHYGGGIPPAIDERMKEWHRQAHGDAPAATPTTPPPPPVPDK